MWSKRAYVDFTLRKRATIAAIYRGLNTTSDACDAHPYLRMAAKHHGLLTQRDCPMCRREKVHELQYTFGDQLGQYSGRIKSDSELDEMQSEFGEFRVYVVSIRSLSRLQQHRHETLQIHSASHLILNRS